jgi:hypothetical protein
MPCEILQRMYFGDEDVNPLDAHSSLFKIVLDTVELPDVPILHNFLHDLEAVFWTGLWIITTRVNYKPSESYALNIFQDTLNLTLPEARLDAFESSIQEALDGCLLEQLNGLAWMFDAVRDFLHSSATVLGQKRAWLTSDGLKIYSILHANFAVAFARLADPQAVWAAVQLLETTSSSPRLLDAIVDEDPKKPEVAPDSEAEEKEKAEEEEGLPLSVKPREPNEEERAHADAPPASSRKRSHHHGKEADGDDGEGRSSDLKRAKANDGGRISAAGPRPRQVGTPCDLPNPVAA